MVNSANFSDNETGGSRAGSQTESCGLVFCRALPRAPPEGGGGFTDVAESRDAGLFYCQYEGVGLCCWLSACIIISQS